MKHEIAHEILCWESSLGDRGSQGFGLQFWTRSSRLGIETPEARIAVIEPQFWLWRIELAALQPKMLDMETRRFQSIQTK